MNDEIDPARNEVVALGEGKWCAYLHGGLVRDLQGRMIVFDSEADARAFLDEAEARATSVDS